MARLVLVGPDLIAANIVRAEAGYEPPQGYVAIASDAAQIGQRFDPMTGLFSRSPAQVEARRVALVAAAEVRKNAIRDAGAPYQGKRIAVDDASRANLGAVVTTALLLETGAITAWPEEYAQGWICMDNSRIPLTGPVEGIMLGMTAARWYAGLVQFCRDTKDAILAAEDPEAADAARDWSPWDGGLAHQ